MVSEMLTSPPVATAEMLIRRPVAEVFEAFVDPHVGSKFWFSKSTGRLEPARKVRWEWEKYGFSTEVTVLEIVEHRKIRVEWSFLGTPTEVEWTFTPLGEKATYVVIKNYGFQGDADKVVSDALRAMGGFHFVLAGLKAYLEHGIELNLIADAFPNELRFSHE
jgi:uncharacterized protein YndB with AHSA1/START domain